MRHARRACPRVVPVKATQVQGLDNEALLELANERREDPLIAELADRLAEALDSLAARASETDDAYAQGWSEGRQYQVDNPADLP